MKNHYTNQYVAENMIVDYPGRIEVKVMGCQLSVCYSNKLELAEVSLDGKLNRYCLMINGR